VLIRRAKDELALRKKHRAALRIQRIARGNIGRGKYKKFKAEKLKKEQLRAEKIKRDEDMKRLKWEQMQAKRAKEKAEAEAARLAREKKLRGEHKTCLVESTFILFYVGRFH
jgi:hypothetical protein